MDDTAAWGLAQYFWMTVGISGALIFYGRFVVQWIASEIQQRSVIPVAFWYLSSAGSLMLLAFAVWSRSPLGALGQNVNIVIYMRNLVHIWRERGLLTQGLNRAAHLLVGAVAVLAVGFAASTWYREYEWSQGVATAEARTAWVWLGVGVLGQALFAARFLIQWIVTEMKRKSVIPNVFWFLSVAAALLQGASFVQRGEWVFAAGLAVTLLVYVRNLWFIYMKPSEAARVNTGNTGN